MQHGADMPVHILRKLQLGIGGLIQNMIQDGKRGSEEGMGKLKKELRNL